MDDLYREYNLDHQKRPLIWSPPHGGAGQPYLEFEDANPLCGDTLRVQIAVGADERVEQIRFSGHGCAISQAAASMSSDEVIGMPVRELLTLDKSFVLDLLGSTSPRDV